MWVFLSTKEMRKYMAYVDEKLGEYRGKVTVML